MRTQRLSYEEYMQPLSFGEAHSRLETERKILPCILRQELTPYQQEIIYDYYFLQKNIPQIAKERGKNKSSISRVLSRSRTKLAVCTEKYVNILKIAKLSP